MTRKTQCATPDTEWFRTRLADRGVTQAQLAQAIGISPVLVSRAIGASAQPRDGFRAAELPIVARVLGVTVDELLMRLVYAVDPPYWTIGETLDDQARIKPVRGGYNKLYNVPPWPYPLSAISIATDRFFEWPAHTLIAYDHRTLLHVKDAARRLCVVSTTRESYRLLAYVDAATNSRCTLRLFGSDGAIEDAELTAAHPVLTIRLAQ